MGIDIVSRLLIYRDGVNKSVYAYPCVFVLSISEVELPQRIHIVNILIATNSSLKKTFYQFTLLVTMYEAFTCFCTILKCFHATSN